MTQRRPDWATFFSEPKLADNLTPDVRQKKLAEKRAQQEAEAGRYQISAFVRELYLIGRDGNEILRFETTEAKPEAASVGFVKALISDPNITISLSNEPSSVDVQVRWFGFDIRDVMQAIALDVMRYNAVVAMTTAEKVQLPVGMWYYRNFTPAPYMDPYETIVGAETRKNVDIGGLCDFLGIERSMADQHTAKGRAELARRLVLRAQLFLGPIEDR